MRMENPTAKTARTRERLNRRQSPSR
jgi:hypothetical protein